MKNLILCLIACMSFAVSGASAKIWSYNKGGVQPERVVFKPDYLARVKGAFYIDRIEFFADSTIIKCTAYGYPGSNIKVDRDFVIEANGKLMQPIGLHGMKFGEPFTLLRSGRHMFTMVYPAIDKKIKVMNLREIDGLWSLYGIRLDGTRYDRPTGQEWIEANTFYYPGVPEQLFYPEPKAAKFKGIIGGFDPKIFASEFVVQSYNEITGQSEDVIVPINDDGSFETEFMLRAPRFIVAKFPLNMDTRIYLEPERTASVYFDRNKILAQRAGAHDIYQSAIYNGDQLGMINDELQAAYHVWGPNDVRKIEGARTLDKVQHLTALTADEMQDKISSYIEMCAVLPMTERLLWANERGGMIKTLLDAEARINSEAEKQKRRAPEIPVGYFDFVKDDLNNPLLVFSYRFRHIVPLLIKSRFWETIADAGDKNDRIIGYDFSDNSLLVGIEKQARNLCRYISVDTPPLWWQMMTAMRLTSLAKPEGVTKAVAITTATALKNKGLITETAIYNAISDFYNK